MNFNATTFNYFIGFADLNDENDKTICVEHYLAANEKDCVKQCLETHGIFIHPNIDTIHKMMTLAEHKNFLISWPRKIEVIINGS